MYLFCEVSTQVLSIFFLNCAACLYYWVIGVYIFWIYLLSDKLVENIFLSFYGLKESESRSVMSDPL